MELRTSLDMSSQRCYKSYRAVLNLKINLKKKEYFFMTLPRNLPQNWKNLIVHLLIAGFFGAGIASLSAESLFAEEESHWHLLNGQGKQVPPDILEVTGNGTDIAEWQSELVPLTGGYYRFSVSHRGIDTAGGILPCGIEGFHRDYATRLNQWTDESFYFRLPHTAKSTPLRVGQWESKGTFQFRNAKLEPVVPIFKEFDLPLGKLWLDEGESIRDGKYLFRSNFGGKGTNVRRIFADDHTTPRSHFNVTFNSPRWCFGSDSQIQYNFNLATRDGQVAVPLTDGRCTINVNYYVQGEGIIEASTDTKNWTELAKINKVETKEIVLSANLFPADCIILRIRGLDGCNFQVDRIDFEASLPKTFADTELHSLDLQGETLFATVEPGKPLPSHLFAWTQNNEVKVIKRYRADDEDFYSLKDVKTIPLKMSRSPGEREQKFEHDSVTYSLITQTHPLERSDYGYRVSAENEYWWCEADWKVSRDRLPPEKTETPKPITISAAKNDVEGFQFVIRANDDAPITKLTGSITALQGPGGAVIPAENVDLLYAYYHFIHSKTDETGLIGDVPDALPPLVQPIDIPAGKNQPIWISVKVPANAAAGDYKGTFSLKSADGKFDVTVPYTLHVWNFALPAENHFETAYGYNSEQAMRYHNAKSDADRRRINEMYLQCFSDHRISVYNLAPFDEFKVRWLPKENPPRCEIDFLRYDAEMDRVMKKFHFTNFTVPGYGLGSGTFHSRTEPSLAGFAADTPEYKAMMADYYGKLQTHLIEKGWIDKAYIYWFDEPGLHDYEFVADGTAKIQKYAPKIQRFMTLNNEGFQAALDAKNTSINIWCSISDHFHEEFAKKRMALGERFWWYVCTGPKAPYCTLFIDHPATELRIWHWQAWQRDIVGGLVWESTFWHSGTAFPNSFQNPYEDPMGYTTGYSVPSGTKIHWGNGDGRFIYPPLAAAVPGKNGGQPVFDKPVSSIRWEMIREGIEDYEMLYLLRELLAQKGDKLSAEDRKSAEELLRVPESITKSMTEFTIDPRPLLQRRITIAKMIEKL